MLALRPMASSHQPRSTIDPADPALTQAEVRVGARNFTLTVYAARDAVSARLQRFHVWHPAVSMFLTHLLQPGDVFVDVGAHVGYFSALAATLVGPRGRVIAFEPDHSNFALLRHNLRSAEAMVEGKRIAIADSSGSVSLLRDSKDWGHHRIASGELPVAATIAPAATLTDELRGVANVRCIKIDVQGAERAVLDGLRGYLEGLSVGRQPFVILDISPAMWLKRDADLAWLNDFLTTHRYDVHLFLGGESLKLAPPRIAWDAFAALVRDIAAYNHPTKELDLLLAPQNYWSWLLKRYAQQEAQP
ncbi:MAG: FkbM family methyltransferase [Alphaproteobacteria bacterium]|nr:FkbM family methyltransferase [Alphaproteobacteria bacterium]